ncbi:unnamed protein product [Discosporangium mesarthrocarpum]
MKYQSLFFCFAASPTVDAFHMASSLSRVAPNMRLSSSARGRAENAGSDGSDRRSFLEKSGLMIGGALAWLGEVENAEADFKRPSAKGLVDLSVEIMGSNKQPINVEFLYPSKWTPSSVRGNTVSVQDYKSTDRVFSMVVPLPEGVSNVQKLPISFFTDVIFDLNGPYGTFGQVEDYKVLGTKNIEKGKRTYRYVDLKFAALTQGLLQVDRRACVAATVVGEDVILFTGSVLLSRWAKVSDVLAEMIVSDFPGNAGRPKEPQEPPLFTELDAPCAGN